MSFLILGLVLFLGVHSVRLVADDWRSATLARIGERAWKLAYSVVAVAGFVLICWGYAQARQDPVALWSPPVWTRHLAALLTVPAFVLVAAAYVPGNMLKDRLGHPMVLGVKMWALAHLLANGTLADLLLFGGFLGWAVLAFRSLRRRQPARRVGGGGLRTGLAVVIGLAAWAGFAFWAHPAWIGVRPFG